jgi:hypothetical protein
MVFKNKRGSLWACTFWGRVKYPALRRARFQQVDNEKSAWCRRWTQRKAG